MEEASNMGVITSRFNNQDPQFEGDEVTGLSAADKRIMWRTFNIVKQDLSKNGEKLFIIFFTNHPQYQKHFKDFKDKPVSELKGTPKLIAHGTNVMQSFNSLILNLNQPEIIVELLLKLGYNHGRHNIDPQAIIDLKATIVQLFKEILKDALTEQAADTWSRALDVILKVFKQGMDTYHKEH